MATTAAQESRRPTAAVAGMTMPEVDRRSPASPSTETRTRSWSMRIARRSGDVVGGPGGAVWVTSAGYPRLGATAAPYDDDHHEQHERGGRRGHALVPQLALGVRDEAESPRPGVVRRAARDLLGMGPDDEFV